MREEVILKLLVGPQPLASEKNSGKIPVSVGEDNI